MSPAELRKTQDASVSHFEYQFISYITILDYNPL